MNHERNPEVLLARIDRLERRLAGVTRTLSVAGALLILVVTAMLVSHRVAASPAGGGAAPGEIVATSVKLVDATGRPRAALYVDGQVAGLALSDPAGTDAAAPEHGRRIDEAVHRRHETGLPAHQPRAAGRRPAAQPGRQRELHRAHAFWRDPFDRRLEPGQLGGARDHRVLCRPAAKADGRPVAGAETGRPHDRLAAGGAGAASLRRRPTSAAPAPSRRPRPAAPR